jgi:hypothetical protein
MESLLFWGDGAFNFEKKWDVVVWDFGLSFLGAFGSDRVQWDAVEVVLAPGRHRRYGVTTLWRKSVMRILRRIIPLEQPSPPNDMCSFRTTTHMQPHVQLFSSQSLPVQKQKAKNKHTSVCGHPILSKHKEQSLARDLATRQTLVGSTIASPCSFSVSSLQQRLPHIEAQSSAYAAPSPQLAVPPPALATLLPPPTASVALTCSSRGRPLQFRQWGFAAPVVGICISIPRHMQLH